MLIHPRVNEPWELHQISSKKLGYNKYLINGNNWRSASNNFDHSSVIMQRSGRLYIHYAKGNRFERNYTNGTYYRSGFNRNFRELQDTF